jgi:hypothetical protein
VFQRQIISGAKPVGKEYVPLRFDPLPDQLETCGRKPPGKQLAGLNAKQGFGAALEGVDMGRRMILPVHGDRNAKERGYGRHHTLFRAC